MQSVGPKYRGAHRGKGRRGRGLQGPAVGASEQQGGNSRGLSFVGTFFAEAAVCRSSCFCVMGVWEAGGLRILEAHGQHGSNGLHGDMLGRHSCRSTGMVGGRTGPVRFGGLWHFDTST